MTREIVALDPQLSVREAMERLALNHLSGAPVMAGQRVVGVVSATDLLDFAAALPGIPGERVGADLLDEERRSYLPDDRFEGDSDEPYSTFFVDMWDDAGADATARFSSPDGPEWNVLEEHTVSEVMTRAPLHTLPPGASVTQAAELMTKKSVHRILVVDEDKLVGIVTSSDVARSAGEEKLGTRTDLFNDSRRFDDRGWE
jgi:CBS domain-containing protein